MVKLKSDARKGKTKKEISIKKDYNENGVDNEIVKKRKIESDAPIPIKKIKKEEKNGEEVKKEFKSKNGVEVKKEFKSKNGDKKALIKKNFDKKQFNGKKSLDGKKQNTEEKPQLSQKELKVQRRMKKLSTNYQIGVDIKKIWETLRKADTTDEVRQKLCRTLHEHVKSKVKTMAFAHDTVRVIECLVQYGNENQRSTIFTELKDSLAELSKSKYGRFLILKMLNYGHKDQKNHVISSFKGFAVKLIKHSFACKVIESIFNEHANQTQRNQILSEFYDFKSVVLMDTIPKSLNDIITAQPQSKEAILENIKNILTTCIDKSILMFSLIHRVFFEYFSNCDQKQKSEMIDILGEHLIHIIHTKDGAEVAKQCVWFSTAKQRKSILKGLKSFILKISCEERGHCVLISIFDSVDDTKLVSKIILDELFRSIDELMNNEYGRKILLYLLAPRDKKFFIKDYSRRLEGGDSSETKKKDKNIRATELLQYSIKYLSDYLNKNLSKFLTNGPLSVFVPLILNKIDNPSEIFSKLANLLLEKTYEKVDNNEKTDSGPVEHLIENSVSHLALKHIFQNDKEVENKDLETLTEILLKHSNSSSLKSWCECNRGCFLFIAMIESCGVETQKKIKKLLKDVNLEKYSFAGAKVLRKKLDEIKYVFVNSLVNYSHLVLIVVDVVVLLMVILVDLMLLFS